MAEIYSSRRSQIRDVLTLLQVVIALGVVVGAFGSYFLIQDHIRTQGERITTLEQWKENHEDLATREFQDLDILKERVDACCPLYQGGRHR